MTTETLRDLIIESLLEDIASNCCEFELALQEDAPPYGYPADIPLTSDGFVDASKITREILENRTDRQLLRMFDRNACLRYR